MCSPRRFRANWPASCLPETGDALTSRVQHVTSPALSGIGGDEMARYSEDMRVTATMPRRRT